MGRFIPNYKKIIKITSVKIIKTMISIIQKLSTFFVSDMLDNFKRKNLEFLPFNVFNIYNSFLEHKGNHHGLNYLYRNYIFRILGILYTFHG